MVSTLCWVIAMIGLLATRIATVEADGLGDSIIWNEDTDSTSEIGGHHDQDTLFKVPSDHRWAELESDLKQLIQRMRIDVVAPSKELVKMMNTVSTKTRAMFLTQYEYYFKELNVGSTSRPMLYTYLGFQMTSPDQLATWYKPMKGRLQTRLLASCRSLIDKRQKSFTLSEPELALIHRAKLLTKDQYYLAYFVFQNNQNLFMLDQYLELCHKLESEQLGIDFEKLNLMV